jgi:hypothetical protein
MELFLRGGNAWEAFARPSVGARIALIADVASGQQRPDEEGARV